MRNPKPTKTNWEGRFEVNLRQGTFYRVVAQDGEKRAEARVVTRTPGDKEVLVRFAGALSIRGLLLDPNSRPLAGGRVRLWETVDLKDRDPAVKLLITSARTESDGSFQIDVERHGRYRILGTAKGHANSELTSVEVTEVRPHAEVVVRLLQPTSIAGAVRHQNGEPVKGVRMFLKAEQGEDPMWADRPTSHDLFARVASVTTGEDGSFKFRGLHPKATYTLTCCPDPKSIGIKIRQKGVEPGRQDILMVLTEAAIRGSSITGTVVADDTGDPVTDFRIKFVHYRDDHTVRAVSRASSAVIESERYTLPGLSLGATYSFVVLPKNYAPTLVGPISTTRQSHVLDVRVKQPGGIECRVVDEQGKAVVNTKVWVRPVVRVPGAGHRLSAPTKAEGMLHLSKLSPGEYEVYVLRNGQKLEGKRVTVVPGKTTEVELRIPR